MPTFSTLPCSRGLRVLVALACVLGSPAAHIARAAPVGAAPPAVEPAVRGLIVRLRDAPDHAATPASAATAPRRQALALSASRWQSVLKGAGLERTPGLHLQPVGRNAWRVVFTGDRSRASVTTWVAALSQRAEVQWAVPNERETALQSPAVVPDDPMFGANGQWWLSPAGGSDANAIDARRRGVPGFQTAWARTTGSAATVIAVLDTGIAAHPDLDTRRLVPGYDMVSDWDDATGQGYANDGDGRDGDATDPGDWVDAADQAADPARYGSCVVQASDWHGTAVAGFLAAATNNAQGIAASDWSTRVQPVRVAGKCGAEVADIIDGLRWAAGLQVCRTYTVADDTSQGCAEWAPVNPTPARVVNISFGGSSGCSAAYQEAIDEVRALGVVIVAAGGNGHGEPTRPASCTGVVGVAALNRDGFKTAYSDFGPSLAIATVGGDDTEGAWGALLTDGGLLGLGNDGATVAGNATYPRHYGTSFAAPIVAGAAALMLAADPTLSADDVIAGLRAGARPHVTSTLLPTCSAATPGRCVCTTATCGAGILDADQAVAWAQAHAQGIAWVAPHWPTQVIANADVRAAVALGVDIVGTDSAAATPPSTGTTTSTNSGGGSGGGAMGAVDLLALAACGVLIGSRKTSRSRRR